MTRTTAMKHATVSIAQLDDLTKYTIHDGDIRRIVYQAMDGLRYQPDGDLDSVAMKVNLRYYWDHSTGETTDPRIVSALIDYIRERYNRQARIIIAEADASAMRAQHAFTMLGFDKLAKEKSVELVNLGKTEAILKKAKVGRKEYELPIPKLLLKTDLLINVPKLKVHRLTGITCALKNIFGAISKPKKYVYHNRLAHIIAGINKIVRTNIALVDGIVVAGKTPKKLGVAMASDNVVACDFIAAKAIGCEPFRVEYLKLALKEKLGDVNDLHLIENSVKLSVVRKDFPKQNFRVQKLLWKMQLGMLKMYSKVTGDIIPPILWENNR